MKLNQIGFLQNEPKFLTLSELWSAISLRARCSSRARSLPSGREPARIGDRGFWCSSAPSGPPDPAPRENHSPSQVRHVHSGQYWQPIRIADQEIGHVWLEHRRRRAPARDI